MLELIRGANLVITDSGGVYRESIFSGTPVFMARDKHEFHDLERYFDGETEKKIIDITRKLITKE